MKSIIKCPICNYSFIKKTGLEFNCDNCNTILGYDKYNNIRTKKLNSYTKKFIIYRSLYLSLLIFVITLSLKNYPDLLAYNGVILFFNPLFFLIGEAKAFSDFNTIFLYKKLIIDHYTFSDFKFEERFWLIISLILMIIGACFLFYSFLIAT